MGLPHVAFSFGVHPITGAACQERQKTLRSTYIGNREKWLILLFESVLCYSNDMVSHQLSQKTIKGLRGSFRLVELVSNTLLPVHDTLIRWFHCVLTSVSSVVERSI